MAKILIIDDDPAIRRLVDRILTGAGHTVLEAENGAAGVRIFHENLPPLVITDILMPEKEGIETIREIHAESPDTKIVAISGGGSSHDMKFLDFARMLGASAVLAKPFRAAELVEIVERLLE